MSDEDYRFDFGERLGIFLAVESAALSAIAVSSIFIHVGYRMGHRWFLAHRRNEYKTPTVDASDSVFFLNLMLAEFVQAVGGLMNIRWIVQAHITEDKYCVTQGVLKQMGDLSVALTSLTIAIHTFCVLIFRWSAPRMSKSAIALIWSFILLAITIPATTRNHYYGSTGFWCWIREEYTAERIGLEYVWLWICAGIMLLLYAALALVMGGLIIVDEEGVRMASSRKHAAEKLPSVDSVWDRGSRSLAFTMLFYPAVYIFCVLPVSVVRWYQFSRPDSVPPGATIFASVLFSSSGFFNAILYSKTRPRLVKDPKPCCQHHKDPVHGTGGSYVREGRLPDWNETDDIDLPWQSPP